MDAAKLVDVNVKRKKKVRPSTIIVGVLLGWFIFSFLIYPNLNTLYTTFFGTGTFSLESFQKLFRSDRAMDSLRNSFLLAFTLIVTVNVVGVFLILVTDYFDIKGARLLRLGYFTTLIYSGVVLVSGYKFVYDQNGFMTKVLANFIPGYTAEWFQGYWAVVFVMTFACTTNHVLFLSNAMQKIDYQTIEAAKNLGASQFYILRRVVLPVLKPTLYALTILTFLTGLSATSAPLILGGREFETITPMILTFSRSATSQSLAVVLALLLGVATVILLSFMIRSERRGNFMSVSKVKSELVKQKIENKAANVIVHTLAYLLFALYMIPVVLIIIFSLTDALSISTGTLSLDRFTLANYQYAFSSFEALEPYIISLLYGLAASFLVVALCLIAARIIHKQKNWVSTVLEYFLMIPWFLPSTLIAMGLIVTFNVSRVFIFNEVLTGTVWLLLLGYVLIKIPFTLRMTKAAFFSIDDQIEEAAQNLGASSLYTFIRVLFPIILPSVMGVFALNMISIIQDYDLTVFLYHPVYEPLGVMIQNATSAQSLADTKALSLVYSVILMVMSTFIMYSVYGTRKLKLRRLIKWKWMSQPTDLS